MGMNKRRLLKLAKLLDADAVNETGVKFDLGCWGVKVDCGTQACAVGLACLSGAFKKEGLRYKIDSWHGGFGNNLIPRFKKLKDWEAVEKFFGISDQQAVNLFSASAYLTYKGAEAEQAVANRIRELVASA
jgi:hypothetical protein